VEVHVEDIARVGLTLVVAGVLPLATDARITQDGTAVHLGERRTQLATMRDLVDRQPVWRSEREDGRSHFDTRLINEARYQRPATRDTAYRWSLAPDTSSAGARGGRDCITGGVIDAQVICAGDCGTLHGDRDVRA
jgi:hypothetical protein